MIDIKDQDGNAIPGLPVSAIFIDGDGKVWAFQFGPNTKISGVKSLLGCAPEPADPDNPVIEVSANIVMNPPANSDSPLRHITALKYCTDKLGNRVPCPPRF